MATRKRQQRARRRERRAGTEQPPAGQQPPAGLTPAQYTFALTYLEKFNATAAYRAGHPGVTENTARVEGSRTLANPDVRSYLRERLEPRWKAMQMTGDEALARVSLDAQADIRLLFDHRGRLLPPSQWPDEIAHSVEAVEMKSRGIVRVKLVSKLAARRVILELTGMLKQGRDFSGFDHVAYLVDLARRRREDGFSLRPLTQEEQEAHRDGRIH